MACEGCAIFTHFTGRAVSRTVLGYRKHKTKIITRNFSLHNIWLHFCVNIIGIYE